MYETLIIISNQRIQMKTTRHHFAPMRLQKVETERKLSGGWDVIQDPSNTLAGETGTAIVGRHLAQADQIQDMKAMTQRFPSKCIPHTSITQF